MKRIILLFLAALGGVVLFTFAFLLAMGWFFLSPSSLPDRTVLDIDLEEGVVESFPQDPLSFALERHRLRTRDVVEAMDRAAEDSRVGALLVRGGGGLPGWGTAEELREGVERFRESGKPAVFFVDTFGEFAPGQLNYHLATAFDEVYMQPSGDVGLAPLQMEAFFFEEALENLEVIPRFDRRWEYKDVSEMFTERGFTGPAREARIALLESLEASLIAGMSQGRAMSGDSARTLLSGGPYRAREAQSAGLVDGLRYLDQVHSGIESGLGDSWDFVGVERYLEQAGRSWDSGSRVAVVYGVGMIHRGQSGYDPLTGGGSMGAATVAAAIREAVDDRRVRALLFRVNSPGGSWVASDQIRREIRRARDRGIPVVVSMGDVAASGGYVVSMDADRIVAHPSTLTGSIGVVAGRLVTRDFWASWGVDWERIQASDGDPFFSVVDDFTEGEWETLQGMLDRIYEDFVGGVAASRGMSPEEAGAVARGRVWSGRDAIELGLVDRSGGFLTALEVVRELLDEDVDAPLQVVTYPADRTLFEFLMQQARNPRGARASWGGRLDAFASPARSILRSAAEAGLVEIPGPVRMRGWEVPGP